MFKFLQGRTTTFLIFFSLTGTMLHIFHRLDSTYLSFIGIVMTFVLGHSVKEDFTMLQSKLAPATSEGN